MTGTWTEDELDAALHDLADVLDRNAGDDPATSLAAVRARLTGTPAGDAVVPAEVLEFGGVPGPRGRRRLAPVLLVAAALVVAVALAAAFWPRGVDRATGPGGVDSDLVRQELALLPRPLPPATVESVVLFETSGAGDATFTHVFTVPSPPAGARALAVTYGFVCGDPTASPPPGDTGEFGATLPDYSLADGSGVVARGSCSGIGDGTAAASYASTGPLTAAPDGDVRVTVPRPDIVWRLVVSIAPVG